MGCDGQTDGQTDRHSSGSPPCGMPAAPGADTSWWTRQGTGLDGRTDGRTDTAQVRRLVGRLLHLGQTRHGGLDRGQALTDGQTDGQTQLRFAALWDACCTWGRHVMVD